MKKTVFRSCHICEANCGLRLEVEDGRVVSAGPDEDDVFSKGFICPKGAAIGDIYGDQDRLTQPVRRRDDGTFEPIGWDEAFRLVGDRLRAIRNQHGANAIGLYVGNPIIHNTGGLLLRNALVKAIGTRNASSASSQDTAPRFATSYYLYGFSLGSPIPDIESTDYLLCIGANPRVSNGSVLTAPDMRGKLRALRERGGRLVVVDPRRTETARDADEHLFIRPGSDAALLFGMIHAILHHHPVDRDRLNRTTRGWQEMEDAIAPFTPERAAQVTGIDAETIRRLAREFMEARTSVAYSRIGVCNNEHGTLATVATDVLNLVAGRLGAPGGYLFPKPLVDLHTIVQWTSGDGHGRWRTRIRGLPETFGDIPTTAFAEEMETPGYGQIKAFITYAGNPVLSAPNGNRLRRALANLDFMVSIDPYINETTRHADVILPPCSGLEEEFVDLLASRYAVRTMGRVSPAIQPRSADQRHDWEILLGITEALGGGPTGHGLVDGMYSLGKKVGIRWTPEATVDLLIRTGPHGDRWLPWSTGWNLAKLRRHPHGVDLGPVPTGTKHGIYHRDGLVHLDARPILSAMKELAEAMTKPADLDQLLLIGRRELRSNNSWLHNCRSLVTGKARCHLLVHPDDADRLGLRDGEPAMMTSRVHRGEVIVKISDEMRAGVVSLPHGWGHQEVASWQQVAGETTGVSANDWTDDQTVESVVGQSILNGVPVELEPCVKDENSVNATTTARS